jgi:hypothetical protein
MWCGARVGEGACGGRAPFTRQRSPSRSRPRGTFVGGLRFSLLLPRAFVQTTVRLSLRLPFVWQLLEPFHDRLAVLVTELLLQQPLELRRPK